MNANHFEKLSVNPLHGQRWVATIFAKSVLDYLEDLGIDTQFIIQELNLKPQDFEQQSHRINDDDYTKLMQLAEKMTGDTRIGFHCGKAMRPSHFGILGYVLINSETLGEAVEQGEHYQSILGDVAHIRCAYQGDNVELHWFQNGPHSNPQFVEHHAAGLLSFARWITRTDASPLRVCFTHDAPESLEEHQAFYRCELLYNQPQNSIVFPNDYLKFALPPTDSAMKKMMSRYAENVLGQLTEQKGFISQVKCYLHDSIKESVPTVEEVASHFKLTVRTLQRRLKAKGYSYKQLLDEVRKELAVQYVADESLHLPDLAFVLGFSEQSSFQRAFKRWTGLPPGEYRKQRAHEKEPDTSLPLKTGSKESPATKKKEVVAEA